MGHEADSLVGAAWETAAGHAAAVNSINGGLVPKR
jgi:hypothetical protein